MLTSLVTYIKYYKDDIKKHTLLYFGFNKIVAVIAIIGKQTLKKWRENIDFDEDFLVSNQLNTNFALK